MKPDEVILRLQASITVARRDIVRMKRSRHGQVHVSGLEDMIRSREHAIHAVRMVPVLVDVLKRVVAIYDEQWTRGTGTLRSLGAEVHAAIAMAEDVGP